MNEGPDAKGTAYWFPSKGDLGLTIEDLSLLFSDRNIGDLSEPGIPSHVNLRQLQRRAREADLTITEISVGSGTRKLDYAASDNENLIDDEGFESLDTPLGGGGTIATATVATAGVELPIDFRTTTARTRVNSKLALIDLVEGVVPLVRPVTPALKLTLDALLNPTTGSGAGEDAHDAHDAHD